MGFELDKILRANIRKLTPYSSARSEFTGSARIYLDANENPYDNGLNRYPDPLQIQLKSKLSELKAFPIDQIALGNGSDELINLTIQAVCNPGVDQIITTSPTYPMYQVAADIFGVEVVDVPLDQDYQLDLKKIKSVFSERTKILFICSPIFFKAA